MREGRNIAVIIPALNEEHAIGKVLDSIPDWADDIVVADNGSTDKAAAVATGHGARVIDARPRGYGSACLAAMAALDNPDIVVFLDADFSDHPEEMPTLVDPILAGEAEMVIGSRVRGDNAPGALTPQARFGNQLACFLMRLFWGVRYTDLGPFRAIRYDTLMALGMRDPNYGWTVEMQIKAARHGVRATEVPVRYRKRIGRSKVSGTLRGVIGAGTKILSTIFLSALQPKHTHDKVLLVLFTRYPIPGTTKTRLIPALGPEGAAALQRKMTQRMVEVAREFIATPGHTATIRYADGDAKRMRDWLGEDLDYAPQGEGDLGERMRRSFQTAFGKGAQRVLIIGSDCPEITAPLLHGAVATLDTHVLVLGPAHDGGYYLIGLRRGLSPNALHRLFDDMPWGTGAVLTKTLERAKSAALDTAQLRTLHDIDRPEDLQYYDAVP